MEREHRKRLSTSSLDKTEERSEIREGKREGSLESFWDCYRVPNWEHTGGALEDSYRRHSRRRRLHTDAGWPHDARSEKESSDWITEGTTAWEASEQTERVEEDWGRQTCKPWYKSSMEKSPVPNLSRGEKTQTRVSGNNGDDKQLFIPLGGGVEGRSGEAHKGVGGEVVQPDIHGAKEKRKVEEDPGLQSSKRESAGKALQNGFPGNSGGTPGEERLDDHSGHIECIPGCIEIDLTGDSPVPEKFGLDTVGGEAEARTRKERGVFGMELEFREDGSDAPREEESAAARGYAKMDSTCKEKEYTKDERLCSTPREAEFCEVTTPTSELVDEAYEILAKAGNSPRGLEGNGDSQPNDSGRINTLEENPAGEQTKMSEEENKASSTYNRCFRAGMGYSVNNTDRKQKGEDICPRKMDPPGECVSDKRKGVQSSVEEITEKGSMNERTEDVPYLSEDRQYVHKMDNTEEEGSAIAHSNTESIGEETEQPGHNNTDGTSPGRTEYGSRCTQPDGEKAGLHTEGGES
ncbi:uncharacterized protein MONOS_15216 [Monocercomonoides exilis]|uniref:uncharacterized protein n=1 Tax=Monocercomonoides exilis TaxID=2049356 RepID=UPI00355A748E|nr:hypothetical protein MONOS_15216 [Monocercomonoides exilis]|eukprot:MONOS_15216.1-p1 / transcript=MONOS_15216.1 / gene=MONOS_15216 / organism=Monocercomonoides_exilis_PA203 / gene_product=unspecified product / transcript_product=unspecified product / location=Mono_scaffold01172:3165-4940(-) / protein_length=522 / sequence_SO=supercontig / SO=protein_coding / is_pseudo=false